MASFKTVLIIGHPENHDTYHHAGRRVGPLGTAILDEFLNSSYEVSVLSRKESTATFRDGIKVFKVDYKDFAAVKAAMKGQDVVISNVGGHAAGDQQIFVDSAVAAGVKRFFPSEYGPDTRDPKMAEINPHTTPHKAALVDYLRSKETLMSWTALIVGGFFEWAMGNGFFGFDFKTKTVGLIDDGVSTFASSRMTTIARAIRASLDHAEETKNQYVFIASFHHTQRDILDVIERLDGQKWTIEHLRSEEVIANGHRRLQAGEFAGIMDLTRGAALGKMGLVDLRPHGLWNAKLGLPEDNMAEVLKNFPKQIPKMGIAPQISIR